MRRAPQCLAVVLVLMFYAASSFDVRLAYGLSQEEEIRISRDFRRKARRHWKFIEDPEVALYVDRMGRRILEAIGNNRYPYRFLVIKNGAMNAFAVPGGSIFFHSGLIQRVETSDELAFVVAHEIVHVNARHIAKLSEANMLVGMLGVLLTPVLGPVGLAIALHQDLEFTRQMEEQADNLGVGYLARAGYDPQAAVDFMNLLNRERLLNPSMGPLYLRTHPTTEKRTTNLLASIRALGLKSPRFRGVDEIGRVKLAIQLQNDPEAVMERLRIAYEKRPDAAMLMYSLGIGYVATGRWIRAREMLERANRLQPAIPNLDRDLGRAYAHTNESAKAHAAFERMLKRRPDDPITHFYRGLLFEKESRYRQAALSYLRVRQVAPSWPEGARKLGHVYRKLNQPGKAHYYLAQSYLLRDEPDKAIDSLGRAAEHYEADSPRLQLIKDEIATIRAGS